MKQFIIKFLGLDKIQTDIQFVQRENARLRTLLQEANDKASNLYHDLDNKDWGDDIDYRQLERELDYDRFGIGSEDVADHFDVDDIARYIDHFAVANELDLYDVSSNIDFGELARYIDKDDVAACIDLDDNIANSLMRYFEGEKMNDFANIVAEKIADRDGMHQLVSEEIENQNVGNISTDAVQSMIDTAIQQFADSLEVMVSAKLNINK